MPFGFDAGIVAVLAAALLVAAFIRGYTGFGFSAIFLACATLFTNPLPLVPVVFACEIAMTALQAKGIARHIDWRRALTLLAGAAVALPVSVSVMLAVGAETARLVTSALIGVLALVLLSGRSLQTKLQTRGNLAVGVVAGLLNTAGVGGLTVAASLAAQPIAAPVFRATMIVFLTGMYLMTLPWLWRGGLIMADTGLTIALALPLLALGVWLGGRRFLSTSPDDFRKLAILLLLTLSVIGLLRAAASLFLAL